MSIIAAGTTTTTALSSTGNTDGTLQFQVNGTTASVTLNTLGAIGVGSTPNFGTAGQALVSAGSTAAPSWSTNVSSQWTTSGSNIYYNTGNVGIGTASPINNSGYGGLSLNGTSGALFSLMTNGTESSRIASLSDETSIQSKATTGYITFVQGVSGGTERFRIGPSGQFGIGGANYGTSGQVLTSGGSGAAPTWATPSGGQAFVAFGSTGGM